MTCARVLPISLRIWLGFKTSGIYVNIPRDFLELKSAKINNPVCPEQARAPPAPAAADNTMQRRGERRRAQGRVCSAHRGGGPDADATPAASHRGGPPSCKDAPRPKLLTAAMIGCTLARKDVVKQ